MGTYAPIRQSKYCHACTGTIDAMAVICPQCGVLQPDLPGMSEKRILPAFILCFMFGIFGAHRFYVGKTWTAVLQIVTIGGFGIWTLIDLIRLITGTFTDADGHQITEWT